MATENICTAALIIGRYDTTSGGEKQGTQMSPTDYQLFIKRLARGKDALTDAQRTNPRLLTDLAQQVRDDAAEKKRRAQAAQQKDQLPQ